MKSDLKVVDNRNIYGMCYLALENKEVFDVVKGNELLKNLGVKSVRNWMHFESLLIDENTLNTEKYLSMKEIIIQQQEYGIQTIGMNHHCLGLDRKSYVGKVHFDNPRYQEWLEIYEKSWYTLVSGYPEITYWEIDNEFNNHDFMYLYYDKERKLSLKEMAIITVDMLYYASRGIHRANPNAITIMGGLVDTHPYVEGDPYYVLGKGTIIPFLEEVYKIIYSNKYGTINTDDFFECVCWHPYYYHKALDLEFVSKNNDIYNTIKKLEKRDKKVFLTEFGWSEDHVSQKEIATFIESMFSMVLKEMPYVESLHYFRMLNNFYENDQKYGLFHDPKEDVINIDVKTNKRSIGGPKMAAYAYQRAANGSGKLDLNEKFKEK